MARLRETEELAPILGLFEDAAVPGVFDGSEDNDIWVRKAEIVDAISQFWTPSAHFARGEGMEESGRDLPPNRERSPFGFSLGDAVSAHIFDLSVRRPCYQLPLRKWRINGSHQ